MNRFVYDPTRSIPRDTQHPQRKDPEFGHPATPISILFDNESTNEEVPLNENGRPKRKCVQSDKSIPVVPLRKKKKPCRRKYETPDKFNNICQKHNIGMDYKRSSDAPATDLRTNERILPLSPKRISGISQNTVSAQQLAEPPSISDYLPEESQSNRQQTSQPVLDNSNCSQGQTLQLLIDLKKELADLRMLSSEQQRRLETIQLEAKSASSAGSVHTNMRVFSNDERNFTRFEYMQI